MANLGKLMKARAWAKREFADGSIPDYSTVRRWVRDGVIEGRILDGYAYVYESQRAGVSARISRIVEKLMSE